MKRRGSKTDSCGSPHSHAGYVHQKLNCTKSFKKEQNKGFNVKLTCVFASNYHPTATKSKKLFLNIYIESIPARYKNNKYFC